MSEAIQKLMQRQIEPPDSPIFEPTAAEIAAFKRMKRGLLMGRVYEAAWGVTKDGALRMKETTHFTTIN